MSTKITAYQVFLEAPDALDDERRAFSDTIHSFNESEAIPREVLFLPVGWEMPNGRVAHPQNLTTDDLQRIDFFTFVLWDRWSPAAEEQFRLAQQCTEDTGHPAREIVVFFKAIEERRSEDPGDELRRIQQLREQLITNRAIPFEEFQDADDLRARLRGRLSRWLIDHERRLRGTEPVKAEPVKAEPVKAEPVKAEPVKAEPVKAEPGETRPGETQPVEAQPIETQPGETQPGETQPGEAQPIETQPGKTQPAEIEPTTIEPVEAEIEDAIEEYAGPDPEHVWPEDLKPVFDDPIERPEEPPSGSAPPGESSTESEGAGISLPLQEHRPWMEESAPLDAPLTAERLNRYGVFLQRQGMPRKAEKTHQQALDLAREKGPQEAIAVAYGNLGVIALRSNDLERAERMLRNALSVSEGLGRREGMASAYFILGLTYRKADELDRAYQMFDNALRIELRLGRQKGMVACYENLALIHDFRHERDKAEDLRSKARAIREEPEYPLGELFPRKI